MGVLGELIDLVLPAQCVCCQRPGQVWCGDCQPADPPSLAELAHGPPTYAAGEYAGPLRTALLSYKERGVTALAGQLAEHLCQAVAAACREAAGAPLLVPVPSARRAARQRGGDHLLRLARLAGRQRQLPVASLLQLTGPVADSAGLTAEQRATNLAGRLVAQPCARARPVLIVDDIVTTGATLAEAARALEAAGWPVLAGAVIGATRRHWPAGFPADSQTHPGQQARVWTDCQSTD